MELSIKESSLKYYNQDLVAKSAASFFYSVVRDSEEKDAIQKVQETKKVLFDKHPTNIVLRNAADFFVHMLPTTNIKDKAKEKHIDLIKKLNTANKELAVLGAKKIKEGSNVFVHSLNNNIFDIILEASKHKKFTLNLVEHAPLGIGRTLSEKLKKKNIITKLFPDLLLRQAVISSDVCLMGGEAIIEKKGAIVKAGSILSAETAKNNNIPVYVCAHSMKYDSKERMKNMLSHTHEEETHDIRHVYELLAKENIDAYICEHGILKPEHLKGELIHHNSWMFI